MTTRGPMTQENKNLAVKMNTALIAAIDAFFEEMFGGFNEDAPPGFVEALKDKIEAATALADADIDILTSQYQFNRSEVAIIRFGQLMSFRNLMEETNKLSLEEHIESRAADDAARELEILRRAPGGTV